MLTVTNQSEMRGVYCSTIIIQADHDWNVIAETLAGYDINVVVIDTFSTMSEVGDWATFNMRDELPTLLSAFHSRDIKVIGMTAFPYWTREDAYNEPRGQEHLMIQDDTLTSGTYACPIKIRSHIKALAEDLATFDVDGVMFDYIRYGGCKQWIDEQKGDTIYAGQMCYCPECRVAFETWLGEGTIDPWPGVFAPDETRYSEFMEWRTNPITDLVKDVREWMLAINSDLMFSAAVWCAVLPTGRRFYLGQDTARWVGAGYLDFVAPMVYETAPQIPDLISDCQIYFTGGSEGKIPMPFWITTGTNKDNPIAIDDFVAMVEACKTSEADGWIIWRYGGSGTDYDWINMIPYLDAVETSLGLPETFSLTSISDSNPPTITWITSLPASSKIEYNTSPLFTANYRYWPTTSFHYWDIDKTAVETIENPIQKTQHSLTVSLTTDFYFRVQSEDISGITTSQTFQAIQGKNKMEKTKLARKSWKRKSKLF